MKIKRALHVCMAMVLLACHAPFAFADVAGSKDHGMVSRYPGSQIKAYSFSEFDEYKLRVGKDKYVDVEGKLTQLLYMSPKAVSPAQIFRNYEMALEEAGFRTLFKCKKRAECGPKPREFSGPGSLVLDEDFRYSALKLEREEGNVFLSLFVCDWFDRDDNAIFVRVIEEQALETGLVTVNAEQLQEDILAAGHATLHGVYFDTGEATMTPESKPTLAEVKRFLAANPKLNLLVVGHTDNVGTLDFNVDLSMRRAQSVVNTLVSEYGVAVGRLSAFGAGMYAPVASNASAKGRLLNRRVELVQR